MVRKTIILVLLICVACVGYAQENTLFTSYTEDDGVPLSTVTDVIQDNDGFIWVSTDGGFGRFDGYNFHTYKNDPKDSGSLNSSKGERFYRDNAGQLWALTFRGLCRYNSFSDKFTNIITYTPTHAIATVNCIYGEDQTNIYATLCGYGSLSINKTTGKNTLINFPGDPATYAALMYYRGFLDNGKIWICSNGLYTEHNFMIYDIHKHTSKKIPLSLNNIISLNDSEALGVADSCIAVIKKKDYSYTIYPADSGGFYAVWNVYQVSDTEALLCSYTAGLMMFNTVSGKITKRIKELGRRDKASLFARSACYDRSGNLWIGTSADGLKKIQYPFKKFKYYKSFSSNRNIVKNVYADNENLYVGYFNNGLDIFSRKDGFIKNISMPSPMRNNVNAIAPISGNKLLLLGSIPAAGQNNIPLIFDLLKSKVTPCSSLEAMLPESGYSAPAAQFLYGVQNEILTSLGRYFVKLTSPGTKPALELQRDFPNQILDCCHIDSNKFIWIGSYKGAWCCRHGLWDSLKLPTGTAVKSITHDNSGLIWLGTSKGIYVADTALRIVDHFDEGNGLVNEYIYGILYGNDGNIWFSHNKGISVYQTRQKTFRHFTAADGLQSNEFNSGAYFKATDGELFFGGVNGTTSFYPQDIHSNTNVPEVKITNISLFDKPYKTDSAYWQVHTITLPYTDNSVSFEFAALEYTDSRKNEYSYIMEGLDKDWVQTRDIRFARYPALPPGNYIFKVKASNNDGLWNDKPATIYIHIIPPFWMTTWFYVLCTIALISIVAYIVSAIQTQRHQEQLRAIELQHNIQLERERISRDLHDNVGTQLSIINNNLEWISDNENAITESEQKEKLSFIKQSTGEMISVLRETIWALKKEKITFEEFSDKLKTFVNKQLEIYPKIKVIFHDTEGNRCVILTANEALHLFRICQESIANTLKYAGATIIEISLVVKNNKYSFSLSDNGVGFDTNIIGANAGNGLENIKFRANEIRCNSEISSAPGNGTTLTVAKK